MHSSVGEEKLIATRRKGRDDEEVLTIQKSFKSKKFSCISKIVLNLMHLGKISSDKEH